MFIIEINGVDSFVITLLNKIRYINLSVYTKMALRDTKKLINSYKQSTNNLSR